MTLLPQSFYNSEDVVSIARLLLGKKFITNINGQITGGYISETEAYNGVEDRASHAFGGRRTNRTEVMYNKGGCCYVYLCYGVHYLVNVVTAPKNIPHAVLIRGIIPFTGLHIIQSRTGKQLNDRRLTDGPGKVTKALGINLSHNNLSFSGNKIYIEDSSLEIPDNQIFVGPRIGVDYAGEDAKLPYRFLWFGQ